MKFHINIYALAIACSIATSGIFSAARADQPSSEELLPVVFTQAAASVLNTCPSGFLLACEGSNQCCPWGYTLYCPQMAPNSCLNPNLLTSEQLKLVVANCSSLLSCH